MQSVLTTTTIVYVTMQVVVTKEITQSYALNTRKWPCNMVKCRTPTDQSDCWYLSSHTINIDIIIDNNKNSASSDSSKPWKVHADIDKKQANLSIDGYLCRLALSVSSVSEPGYVRLDWLPWTRVLHQSSASTSVTSGHTPRRRSLALCRCEWVCILPFILLICAANNYWCRLIIDIYAI